MLISLKLIRQKTTQISNSARYLRQKTYSTNEIILKRMRFNHAPDGENLQKQLHPILTECQQLIIK